ncbi:MAG: hypothetical protein LBU18_06090 [Treponema sp.]|nr:hypothetical protein [Treponema sp.]
MKRVIFYLAGILILPAAFMFSACTPGTESPEKPVNQEEQGNDSPAPEITNFSFTQTDGLQAENENAGAGAAAGTFSAAGGTPPYTYTLTAGDDKFEIDGAKLKIKTELSAGEHIFAAVVSDSKGKSFSRENLAVSVRKAEAPDFTFTPLEGLKYRTINVAANKTVGTFSGETALGETVTYTLTSDSEGNDADNGKFTIDGKELKINSAALDAGTWKAHITAAGGNGKTLSKAVKITVDVNKDLLAAAVAAAKEEIAAAPDVAENSSGVPSGQPWLTQDQKDAYQAVINAAEALLTDPNSTQADWDEAQDTTLPDAAAAFSAAIENNGPGSYVPPKTSYDAANYEELAKAFEDIAAAEPSQVTINITADIDFTDDDLKDNMFINLNPVTDTGLQGKTITLTDNGDEKKLKRRHSGGSVMFTLGKTIGTGTAADVEKVKLIIGGSLIIQGMSAGEDGDTENSTKAIVSVNKEGILELTGSAKITKNTVAAVNYYSAGVLVYGEFIMSGGEVSYNVNYYGNAGGIYLSNGGMFTMSGGAIHHNANIMQNGTGRYLAGSGVKIMNATFTMSGGEIYSNTVDNQISGTDGTVSGGGVYFYLGTFNKTGGTIYGCDNPEKTNILKQDGICKTDNDNRGIAVYYDPNTKYLDLTADPSHNIHLTNTEAIGLEQEQ